MTREKILDADKKPQDQFDNERLSEEELDGVAGGTGEETNDYPTLPSGFRVLKFPSCK